MEKHIIPRQKKVKFLKKFRVLARKAFDYEDYPAEEKIIKLARKHLKYSKKTYDGDILASLNRTFHTEVGG